MVHEFDFSKHIQHFLCLEPIIKVNEFAGSVYFLIPHISHWRIK